LAYFVTGLVFRERKEYVKALVEAEKAIALDPNYANGHVLVASLLFYAGRPDESVARIKKAMRLNPHHPFNYAFHLGQAYYALERYDEAIKALEGGIATNPASERLHLWLAASYAQAGRIDDAEWEAEQIRVLNPEFNLSAVSEAFPFKDRAISERFLNSLRKAGL
jgi:adenylate cyclase